MDFHPALEALTKAIGEVQADGDVTVHGRGDGAIIVRHTDGEESAIDPTELKVTPAEDVGEEKFPAPEDEAEAEEAAEEGKANAAEAREDATAGGSADSGKGKGGSGKS